ncbi:transcription-repair coupling factor [Flaviflexus salsibiostraticola]|uniref:Transcription-repair-coupling factor n=1 Tax=Flaviflexus salsibiostraticola TaxID=1282737 RepID=A0A3Q8WUK9_9ACTO|nr:transcription-repair coupling factor [Flaviflexus salsibiostraticola]AZN30682.1 transcription-repair coupling factor [Flaviflexus salsibiostraticola]
MEAVLGRLRNEPTLSELPLSRDKRLDVAMPLGLIPGALALLAKDGDRPTVVVTPTGRDGDELLGALAAYLPREELDILPSWETLPHERLSPRADTVATRLSVMRRLAHPEEFGRLSVLIVPIRSLLQPVVKGLGDMVPVRVRTGEEMELEALATALVDAAYVRVDMVESRGQFAIRGGILDVFPPTEPHPLRVEFFGDEIDEIRSFSVADQRSLEVVDEVYAPPCREILIDEAVRERARRAADSLPGARDMLEKIAQGIAVEGMESLAPVLTEGMHPIHELFDPASRVVVVQPERVFSRSQDLVATTEEFLAAAWSSAAAGGDVPLTVSDASFLEIEDVGRAIRGRGMAWWSFGGFTGDQELDSTKRAVEAQEPKPFHGDVDAALSEMGMLAAQGWWPTIVVEGGGLGRRIASELNKQDIPAEFVTELEEIPGVVTITAAPISTGFIIPGVRLAVLAASDITGRGGSSTKDMRKMPSRRRATVDPLQLKPGDYIVHDRHGVGRFLRMDSRPIDGTDGAMREYLVVEYAPSKRGMPGDQLWIPTDSLDLVSRYSGSEAPQVSKMGGADWAKAKAKARKATEQIAGELVRLYATRKATKGFQFSPDTPWQRELEDAFAYVETPDQLVTIDEVKRDMESPTPMDRLISGDVGYGKTEIAIRAAFKAVQDSKQVAVLVPTTLLVSQHLETFQERYAGFPVTVAGLSRFQSEEESEKVKAGIKDGSIDVVVGTHRLLTGSISFKDLGLVIIDEEQRFGVEHKETLTQLRANVDVLSMSATPIPRTLEMAVTGIREMSTLATPPEERHPILTYVGPYEEKQVSAAIRRELLRDGQVFYVHNRVQSIRAQAKKVEELVPEARVAVAHGKMSEKQLETVIQQFWDREVDVLVCTTIIETGLDISNANTLIVDNAERLGLSQLHQLRGRVGRGRERAYAYFLYPPDKAMTETAVARLRTISSHTQLGSGIQVAMKDLEIRGAGNLLGGEQSGHIAGVGFDLYVRMIAEQVEAMQAMLTGGRKDEPEPPPIKLDLPIEATVPDSYVPQEGLRLDIYSKVANSSTEEERDQIRAELVDRYGPIPPAVERMFLVAQIRETMRAAKLEDAVVQGEYLRLYPVALPDSRQMRLKRLHPRAVVKPAVRSVLVPLPVTGKGRLGSAPEPVMNEDFGDWFADLMRAVFLPDAEGRGGNSPDAAVG